MEASMNSKLVATVELAGSCIRACGNSDAGALLFHCTVDLQDQSDVAKDGIRWWVRTKTELMRGSGLTEHKYDRAITILRKLKVVVTKPACQVGFFDRGMTTTAFHLNEARNLPEVEFT
jgi:hypothetical protein